MDVLVEVPPETEDTDQTDASEEWHSSSKVWMTYILPPRQLAVTEIGILGAVNSD